LSIQISFLDLSIIKKERDMKTYTITNSAGQKYDYIAGKFVNELSWHKGMDIDLAEDTLASFQQGEGEYTMIFHFNEL
tara:strand:- start:32 stop:265 length:234 start_codon:yes stop_codon:yes gene_type:complete